MFKLKKDSTVKRNKSHFTKAKKGTVFKEEVYEKQDKTYDFYCPKCRIKFDSDIFKYTVTVNSILNIITKHTCGTRCKRFVKSDIKKIEELFLKSKKTPIYFPKFKKMKEDYRKRAYKRRTKHLIIKDDFEV